MDARLSADRQARAYASPSGCRKKTSVRYGKTTLPSRVIAALLLALADTAPEAIAADYAASTANLRDAYLRRYAGDDPATIVEAVRCPEEAVYNMLDYLDRAGRIRAYLSGIGLAAAEIDRLRARLR